MSELFLSVLNMSLTASYVILFVILIRLILKKAPKFISYAIWGVVALRLMIPFTFETTFSLLPRNINTAPIQHDIIYQQSPHISSGAEVVDSFLGGTLPASTAEASVNPLQIYTQIAAYIWILGMVALIAYSFISILILKMQLKNAQLIENNIYVAENLKTPFVVGFIRPRIYLPIGLNNEVREFILLHEQTHIHRKDHIIKILAFLILSIHWFNPLVWIAFMLMSIDMELSCDERVMKKIDIDIKKPYANSLLSLATGKHILNGSPLAFGEGNLKGRIKNVLNYKKPSFWVIVVAIVAIIILTVALLSNPPANKMTVEDYAWQFINNEIEMYENAEFGSFKIIDKKITKLEQLSTFDNILSAPVELWRLEYRLKPENIDGVMVAGGMQVEDGWITEDSSMGKPKLVFTYENDRLMYLGNANTLEYGMDSLAGQEISIRIMLENKGLLPNETYQGNHVVIKFPLSTGEISQLLLSQPVKQGDSGIWSVERWMDGNGTIYHEVPNLEEDIKIKDYYKDLQAQVNNGHKQWFHSPIEVGYDYIINTLGQILVKVDDLEIINPATVEDFLTTR